MRALGFVCLQAPGEAEAFAAALNRLGAVDAVLSPDGDALTFGARVLLRNVHLSRSDLRVCVLERCGPCCVALPCPAAHAPPRAASRLPRCAPRWALPTAARSCSPQCLCWRCVPRRRESVRVRAFSRFLCTQGCDYNVDGAEHVGVRGCLRAAQQLLRDTAGAAAGGGDTGLLAALRAAFDAPVDPALAVLRGCTGCKRCKHEGGTSSRRLKHLASDGCVACGTACADGGGPLRSGGCVEAPADAPCSCAWHVAGEARALARVVARAAATPGFVARFDSGVTAFRRETAAAEAAARAAVPPTGRFAWTQRPDVARLSSLLARLGPGAADKEPTGFPAKAVLSKTLSLLLLWDLAHAGAPPACFQLDAVLKRSKVGDKLRTGAGGAAGGADAGAAEADDAADDDAAECFSVTWRAAAWIPADDEAAWKQAEEGLAIAAVTGAGASAAKIYRTLPASVLRAHAPAQLAAFVASEARAAAEEEAKASKREAAAAKRAAANARRAAEERAQPKISALLRTQRDGSHSGSLGGGAAGGHRMPKLPEGADVLDYILADSDDDSEPLPPVPAGVMRAQRAADHVATSAAPHAAAAAAGVASPSRPSKRESPSKATGGGGSAKKTRPASVAKTPVQSRDLRTMFGAAATPATTAPRALPPQLAAPVAPEAAARKKLFELAGGSGDDPINLVSPSPPPAAPAARTAEVVDLTADSPPVAAQELWS